MIRTDIGELVISIKKNNLLNSKKIDYVFTPSFENLSKLGDSKEIITAYSVLLSCEYYEVINRFKVPEDYVIQYFLDKQYLQLQTAKEVLRCCCDDDITDLIGGQKKKKGLIPEQTIYLLAKSLLDYGIAGRAKVRISQRNEVKSYSSEFKITDYIDNARIHLGLSLDEAKKLTMTEYILLMAKKFPDNDGITRDEYDQAMALYEKRRKQRIAKAEAEEKAKAVTKPKPEVEAKAEQKSEAKQTRNQKRNQKRKQKRKQKQKLEIEIFQ